MKNLKKWLAVMAVLAATVLLATGAAAADLTSSVGAFRLEQVYVNVPQMNVYFYAQDGDGNSYTPTQVRGAGLEIKIGETTVQNGSVSVASDPICYIVVVDNSDASDPEEFKQMIAAVRQLTRNKAEHDQIMLYTTAGGTKCVLKATTDTMAINKKLASLKRADGRMNLTEAASLVSSDIQADYQALAPRRIAFVCTTSSDLLTSIALTGTLMTDISSQANLALYAFMGTPAPRAMESLSNLTSGRVIPCAPEDMADEMLKKQAELATALEIRTELDDSMYGTRLERMSLGVTALGSAVTANTTVYMGNRLEKPQITQAAIINRNKILLVFNQAISEVAGRPQYFDIVSEDIWSWHVKIREVKLSDDGRSATLITEPLYKGNYNISLKQVASRLTPANISEKDQSIKFIVNTWPQDRLFYLNRFRIPLILAAILLLALVVQWARGRRRDRLAEKGAEAEHLLNNNPEENEPVMPRRYVTIFFGKNGSIAESRWSGMVEGSMMIGSDANQCDLKVPDKRIAPQHCMLYVAGDSLRVVPLEGKTVLVNGERIAGEHRLQNDDTLHIGKTNLALVL